MQDVNTSHAIFSSQQANLLLSVISGPMDLSFLCSVLTFLSSVCCHGSVKKHISVNALSSAIKSRHTEMFSLAFLLSRQNYDLKGVEKGNCPSQGNITDEIGSILLTIIGELWKLQNTTYPGDCIEQYM